ncbi:MAG: hopene-associated glycosyltransferase HpnB [Candidatus Eremiobacteraeota bacterium]|nr:hopene-associated glycosyltransferase HpnB [Candidatus Eremiobacteraeota bacterium]
MLKTLRAAAWIAAGTWIGLVIARGRFWDASADGLRPGGGALARGAPGAAPGGEVGPAPDSVAQAARGDEAGPAPFVHVVVPARNEADVIAQTLGSLLAQNYPGPFAITLIDDGSEDCTGDTARATIAAHGAEPRARVLAGQPRPAGWTGKVWALAEGVAAARASGAQPAYWWFTDADVEHDPGTLARLVATAVRDDRALVSQMVALHCSSSSERLLIPAFVFFFRTLYPFAWVNDDRRSTAAAAGGCVLLSDDALRRIGGIERIKGELIDDCALAAAVKRDGGGLWLGLATRSRSVRPYRSFETIWSMVARTAFTQLCYSPMLLAGTVAGMLLLYYVPVAATVAGVRRRRFDIALPGALAWTVMALAYAPTLRLYGVPRRNAVMLPFAALLYTGMTVDSARRHLRGAGGAWKGRTFVPGRDAAPDSNLE